MVDVAVEDVFLRDRAALGRRRRQFAVHDHVADVVDAGVAAQRKRALAHELRAVVLLGVVRRRNLRAAGMISAGDGEIHHVGRQHAVVGDVDALFDDAVDEGRDERRRREPHVVADGDLARAEIRREAGADGFRAVLVDVVRIDAADVVGLEDVGIEFHSVLKSVTTDLSPRTAPWFDERVAADVAAVAREWSRGRSLPG